jgi:hypothetical protein
VDENLPDGIKKEGCFRPAPQHEDINLERGTYAAAGRAHEALGRLDEAAARLPHRDVLVRIARLRDAGVSLERDGHHYSLQEMLAMDLPESNADRRADPRLRRLLTAEEDAVRQVLAGAPLGATLLGRTARILADDRVEESPGDVDLMSRIPWRGDRWWLGGPRAGDAYLQCLPQGPDLQACVAEYVTWLDSESDLSLVVRLALAHYQLVVLSPVQDSAHLACLLIPLGLIQGGVLRDRIFAPSLWFSCANQEYRRQLRNVVDHGDLDSWVRFFADGVRKLCLNRVRLVRKLVTVRDGHFARLDKLGRRNDGLARLVEALTGYPVFNTSLATRLSGLKERAVLSHIHKLETAEFVTTWDRRRWPRKREEEAIREVPDVVKAIAMYDDLDFSDDQAVFGN